MVFGRVPAVVAIVASTVDIALGTRSLHFARHRQGVAESSQWGKEGSKWAKINPGKVLSDRCSTLCWLSPDGTCKKTFASVVSNAAEYCTDYCVPQEVLGVAVPICISKFYFSSTHLKTIVNNLREPSYSESEEDSLEEASVAEEDEVDEQQADLEVKIDAADGGGQEDKVQAIVADIHNVMSDCKHTDTTKSRDSCCLKSCFKLVDLSMQVKAKCISNCVSAKPKPTQ